MSAKRTVALTKISFICLADFVTGFHSRLSDQASDQVSRRGLRYGCSGFVRPRIEIRSQKPFEILIVQAL